MGLIIQVFLVFLFMSVAGTVVADQSDPGWKAKWEKIVQAAKKEGQVTFYNYNPNAHLLGARFRKKYPEIKTVVFQGRGGMVAQRILAERRAKKFLADVSMEGFNSNYLVLHKKGKAFDPIKPALMLPEVVDESLWWQGRHHYLDDRGRYVFRVVGAPQLGSLSYNTKLVDPKKVRSVWDILDPKWKGKIGARDARRPGPGNGALRFFYHNPKIGPDFIRRLFSEMDLTLFTSFRQGTDWLAQGRYAICFACPGITRAKRQGLPVEEFSMMKEGAGLVSLGSTLAMVNRAAHPNAAKVFINWLLSREGQMAFMETAVDIGGDAQDSLRTDIPKNIVRRNRRRMEGVEYLDLDVPGRRAMKPIVKIINSALAERKKR